MDPHRVVEVLGIYGRPTVAVFGAGSGSFAIPIAKQISPDGKVYAIDIQEEPLSVIRSHKLANVATLRADLEKDNGSKLNNESADWVILANVLHQADKPEAMLAEAFRISKKHGKIVTIDWHPEYHALGPAPARRLEKTRIASIAKECGGAIVREHTFGNSHFGLLITKA